MTINEYYNKIKGQLGTQALLSYQIDGCRLYGKDAICKMLEDYHASKLEELKEKSLQPCAIESIKHCYFSNKYGCENCPVNKLKD